MQFVYRKGHNRLIHKQNLQIPICYNSSNIQIQTVQAGCIISCSIYGGPAG